MTTVSQFRAFVVVVLILCSVWCAVASHPIDNLQRGEWYAIPNSNLSAVLPDPTPPGYVGPEGVMAAWSGGAYDTKRDRLVVWGGGHGDYGGNELYVFDLHTFKWSRIWGPSRNIPFLDGWPCHETYLDGYPASRHTYDGLVYLPVQDRFWASGGSLWCGSGGGSGATWLFDFDALTWQRKTNGAGGVTVATDYDLVTGRVFFVNDRSKLLDYDPATDRWTTLADIGEIPLGEETVMAIDPNARMLVALGNGFLFSYNIQTGELRQQSTTGGAAIVNARGPGLTYDSTFRKIVGWTDGTTLYSLDTTTWTWTQHAAASTNTVTPTPRTRVGVFGRFQYVPSKNVYILVNSIHENVFIYRPAFSGPPSSGQIDIPLKTWVMRPLPPTNTVSPDLASKDMRLAYNPNDKRIYLFGGDYAGAEGDSTSGRTEMYAYSIGNDRWETVHPPCLAAGAEQPNRPDEGTFAYDTLRRIFWWVPGFNHGGNPDNCPSTLVPGQTMSFNPTTKKWTSANYATPPTMGSETTFGVYDPVTDTIIRLVGSGLDPRAEVYNIRQNTWSSYSSPDPGGAWIGTVYTALDVTSRRVYAIDAISNNLWTYHIKRKAFTRKAVPFKIDNYSTSWGGQFDMRVFWDTTNKLLLFPQINSNEGRIRFHTYDPAIDAWEIDQPIATQPAGLTLRGNNGVYDPDQNILLVMGGGGTANPSLFLYRHGTGLGRPAPIRDIIPPAAPTNLRVQ